MWSLRVVHLCSSLWRCNLDLFLNLGCLPCPSFLQDPDLVVEPMSTSSSSSQSARPTASSASSTASSNANEQVRSRNSGQLSLSDIFLNSNELFLLLPKTYLIVCLRIGSSNLWAICYDWCNPKFNALGWADDSVFSQCLGKIKFFSCSFFLLLHKFNKKI